MTPEQRAAILAALNKRYAPGKPWLVSRGQLDSLLSSVVRK